MKLRATATPTPLLSGARLVEGGLELGKIPHLLKLYWLQSPAGIAFMAFDAVILPALVYYFGLRVSQGQPDEIARYLAGGFVTGISMGAVTKVGFSILRDIQLRRLALIRALGIAKSVYIGTHILSATIFTVLSAASSVLIFIAFDLVPLDFGRTALLMLAGVLSGATMGALGAVIAVSAPNYTSGHGRLSLATLGLLFISPVFYDLSALPSVIRVLCWLSPYTHAAALVTPFVSGGWPDTMHLVALIILFLAFGAAALRGLRWS